MSDIVNVHCTNLHDFTVDLDSPDDEYCCECGSGFFNTGKVSQISPEGLSMSELRSYLNSEEIQRASNDHIYNKGGDAWTLREHMELILQGKIDNLEV